MSSEALDLLTHLLHELVVVLVALGFPGSVERHGCRAMVGLGMPVGLPLYTPSPSPPPPPPPQAGMLAAILYQSDYLPADAAI